VDHGTPAAGDIWIVMYEIIRGKPAHSSFQQSSLHTSSDVAAISHTFSTAKEKRTVYIKSGSEYRYVHEFWGTRMGKQSPIICLA
jgi:hypothetical protein